MELSAAAADEARERQLARVELRRADQEGKLKNRSSCCSD